MIQSGSFWMCESEKSSSLIRDLKVKEFYVYGCVRARCRTLSIREDGIHSSILKDPKVEENSEGSMYSEKNCRRAQIYDR